MPPGGTPADYEFEEWDPGACEARTVRLSQLFDEAKDTLFLYSVMFEPDSAGRPLRVTCPMCTSMMDGIDGQIPERTPAHRIRRRDEGTDRASHAHAHTRGWRNIRMLSSAETTYNRDYRAESSDETQRPMATVFVRRDGEVHHFWSSELLMASLDGDQGPRHVDFMWPLWAILDRTPDGRGDWGPALAY